MHNFKINNYTQLKKWINFLITGSEYDNISKWIIAMSLDFVLSEEALCSKESDVQLPGIIRWQQIVETNVYGRTCRTIFPNLSVIKREIHFDRRYHAKQNPTRLEFHEGISLYAEII